MWAVSAAAAIVLALLMVGPSIGLIRSRSTPRDSMTGAPHSRLGAILRGFAELRRSGLLDAGLARRLVILSALRFCVVVLMSIQTAEAINVHIPIWQMAAAVPFVVMASVIALTPGGLGVNELTSVTALKIFGTPLVIGAQWALANRALVAVSYFVVAMCAAIVLAAQWLISPGASDPLPVRGEAAVKRRQLL